MAPIYNKKTERALEILCAGAHAYLMEGNTPDNLQRSYRSTLLWQEDKSLSSALTLHMSIVSKGMKFHLCSGRLAYNY